MISYLNHVVVKYHSLKLDVGNTYTYYSIWSSKPKNDSLSDSQIICAVPLRNVGRTTMDTEHGRQAGKCLNKYSLLGSCLSFISRFRSSSETTSHPPPRDLYISQTQHLSDYLQREQLVKEIHSTHNGNPPGECCSPPH